MVIGYTTGGGYDSYARVLARFIGKHIPGQPGVIAQNMPGAGSLLATNWLANAAPRDGTVIAAINRGIPFEPLTGGQGIQFDPLKLGWIGSLGKEVNVTIAWHTAKTQKAEQLFTDGLIVGGTGSGADSAIYPAIMNNLLGARIKLIAGYPGGNDVNLALERGEIEGRPSPSWSSLRSWRAPTGSAIARSCRSGNCRCRNIPIFPTFRSRSISRRRRKTGRSWSSSSRGRR